MPDEKRPNILLIMDDQHRFEYLGCMGADFLSTSHLDRLASRGIRFTHCFANSPVCVPSRISMASGLLPERLGAMDNNTYLPPHVTTYYQRLRDHGYRVGCAGKLDLAKPDGYNGRYGDRPCAYQWGFTHPEECEGKMHAGKSAVPQGPYTHFLQEQGLLRPFHEDYVRRKKNGFALSCEDSILPADVVEDAYIGARAAEWIDWVPDDFPWFYFVSFVGPHDPYDPPAQYAEKYREIPMPPAVSDSLEGKPGWIRRRKVTDDPRIIAETRRQYCAATQLIDDQVGLILDALERRGMRENTYVIFVSDHGDMLGDHGLYQKSVPYEPSIRVPLLVAGPHIQGGQVSDALIELVDLNPTLCEIAGLPPQPHIDGKSMLPLWFGRTKEHRQDIVTSEYNFRCVRTNTHKLIENFNDLAELYDLEKDPHELINLAEMEPDIVNALRRRMKQRLVENVTYRG